MCISRSSSVSRWQYWIRAWDSVSLRRAIGSLSSRAGCTRPLKGGLTSHVRRPLHSGLSLARCHGRYEHATSRAGSDGGFKAEDDVSPCVKSRRVKTSPGGAGTWQRQAHSEAAPECRRVRVQHERTRTGAMARKNMPASPTRWVMDQLHKRNTTAVRPPSAHASSTRRRAALSDEAHNMAQRLANKDRGGEVPGGGF